MVDQEMPEADHELLIEMLLKLDGTYPTLKNLATWCHKNAVHHDTIVNTWFWAMARSQTLNRRLELFQLASEILFRADWQSLPFFCSFLPIIIRAIPLLRGDEIKLKMRVLLGLWRKYNVYNAAVMDELDKSLRNNNKVVDDSIFFYDQKSLFVHSKRIHRLLPAIDYLKSEVDNSPRLDNIGEQLSSINDRQSGVALLHAVDCQAEQMKTMVEFLEEAIHLLKMTSLDLDMAANREKNGVEQVKLKLLGYGRFSEKVRSVQDTLASVHRAPPPTSVAGENSHSRKHEKGKKSEGKEKKGKDGKGSY